MVIFELMKHEFCMKKTYFETFVSFPAQSFGIVDICEPLQDAVGWDDAVAHQKIPTENIFQTEIQTEATNRVPNWKNCNCFFWADFFKPEALKKKTTRLGKDWNFQAFRSWLFYLSVDPKFSNHSIYLQNRQYSISLLPLDSFWGHRRCPSLSVPSQVRWFQTYRSLPMWKLSPRSLGWRDTGGNGPTQSMETNASCLGEI